ncbi:MAG: hypothetical protein QXP53_01485 [Candidatus Pacearchaeota archaeon]
MNRKGAEINITTVIVIILAILVLVILALYFTGGMKSLWEKITGVKGAWDQTDVENAKSVCAVRCTAQDKEFFCTHEFTLKKAKSDETGIKKCWEDPIKAYNLPECQEAGLTKDSCEETAE